MMIVAGIFGAFLGVYFFYWLTMWLLKFLGDTQLRVRLAGLITAVICLFGPLLTRPVGVTMGDMFTHSLMLYGPFIVIFFVMHSLAVVGRDQRRTEAVRSQF